MVIGIMVGSGIFRTPGLVAGQLGGPGLTLVAWVVGGAVAFAGSLIFAELATRYPRAGGKYVYARDAFGPRVGFVVGWVEGIAIYTAAIAAIGVVCGEYLGRLVGAPERATSLLGVTLVGLFTLINLTGVSSGRWVQNISTAAKLLALLAVIAAALARGDGAGWRTGVPGAPHGAALAVAFQAVIWTYYGYLDAGKIAEEVVEPSRSLPRIYLGAIAAVTTLYLLLNVAYLQVLPFDRIASSNLVAADVMAVLFGSGAGVLFAGVALLVVLASLNGNIFVTPRVIFGLAREGLAPGVLARVNRGGTPWVAMAFVGVTAMALALGGTFNSLLALSITLILVVDSIAVLALLVLRRRTPDAPFRTPVYPALPLAFVGVYGALFVGTVVAQPKVVLVSGGVLGGAYLLSRMFVRIETGRQALRRTGA
ncbi:MAG TPA: amino acid permease [Gemmatimonadales bacterium]|nr:amino acid permease [Gemmatimonadales bacterium]